ncbi:MAG TPA: enoyl-CoA hydratase [Hyphomicrobiaceae bacterium]|nr:enoyl-CoA hydratase [Hyphomicrobiaceae bacterium]
MRPASAAVLPSETKAEPLVLERPEPGIAMLTLNRPETRNSLSLAVLEALHRATEELSADRAVHAVVVAARGQVFCSGHDLKELSSHRADADGGQAFFTLAMQSCARAMRAIMASPKPFIAAVEGTATAAGCQLVATVDLAVVADSATFATPGVNIGLFCSTPMVALSRNLGRKRALEMLLLGEMLDAHRAAEYGLVNRVVPREQVLSEAFALARTIAAKSPAVVAIGKRAFYAQAEMAVADAYDYTARVMVENMMKRDAEEGIGAFLEKRAPKWTGS